MSLRGKSLNDRVISSCKLRPQYLQNLLLICKPSTLCCLTVWCVPMGTFFSITATKQFCLAAWRRHTSCLGVCEELLWVLSAGWPFWKGVLWFHSLGKTEVAVAATKRRVLLLAPKGILSGGFPLRNRQGHWCVVGCCTHVNPINRITEFLPFRVIFRKRNSSAVSFLWLFSN